MCFSRSELSGILLFFHMFIMFIEEDDKELQSLGRVVAAWHHSVSPCVSKLERSDIQKKKKCIN